MAKKAAPIKKLADCFTLPEQPFRSANLEFDYGNEEIIRQYIPTARSAAVLNSMCDALDTESRDRAVSLIAPYGSGKTSLFLFLCALLEKEQKTQTARTRVLRRLKGIQPRLDKRIKSLVEEPSKGYVVVRLSGNQGELSSVWKGGLKDALFRKSRGRGANLKLIWKKAGGDKANTQTEVLELYRTVSKELKRVKFEGIAVLYDEFGKIFESHQSESRTDELFFLQSFAELSSRSGQSRIFLAVAMHQGFAQYAHRLPSQIRSEWVKIEGRFHVIPFVEDSLQVYDLIGQVLKTIQNKSFRTINDQVVPLAKKMARKDGVKSVFAGIKDPKILADIFVKTFPLHPVALYALPRLSARVSQNERTLFHFLLGPGENCLYDLLKKKNGSKKSLDLIKLYDLFEYFSELMASDNRPGGTHRRLMEMKAAMERIDPDDGYAIRLIQSIGLMGVLSDHNKTPVTLSTLEFLFEPLDKDEKRAIKKTMNRLVKNKVLLHKKHSGEYRIWEGSDVDLNGILRQKKAKISGMIYPDIVLSRRIRPPHVIPHRHNEDFCVTRVFEGQYVTAQELERHLSKYENSKWLVGKDGQILFVLADSTDEIRGARKTAQKFINPHVIVAIPQRPLGLVDLTDELYCIEELLEDAQFLSADPVIHRELEELADDCLMAIRKTVEVFHSFRNGELSWWCEGEQITHIKNRIDLGQFVSEICNERFPATPRYNHELINRRKPSPSVVNARKKIIRGLLEKDDAEDLGLSGYGPDLTIFRAVFRNTGIYQEIREGKWEFVPPHKIPNENIRELVEMVHDYFRESDIQPQTIEGLVEKLLMPPYGVREGLIPLVLAAGFKSFYLPLNLMDRGIYIQELHAEHFERMLSEPSDISIQCVPLPKRVVSYLGSLIEVFSLYGATEKLHQDPVRNAVEGLYRWIHSLHPCAMDSNEVSEEAKAFRLAVKKALDPVDLLFVSIPGAMGVNLPNGGKGHWLTSKKYQLAIERLDTIKNELLAVSQKLLSRVASISRGVFHLPEGSTGNLRKDFQAWASLRSPDLKSYVNDPQCSGLLERVGMKYEDDEKLAESLASLVTGKSIYHWDDDFIRQYELNLLSIYNKLVKTDRLLDQRDGEEKIEARLKDAIPEPQFWETLENLDEGVRDTLAMFLISQPARKKIT